MEREINLKLPPHTIEKAIKAMFLCIERGTKAKIENRTKLLLIRQFRGQLSKIEFKNYVLFRPDFIEQFNKENEIAKQEKQEKTTANKTGRRKWK